MGDIRHAQSAGLCRKQQAVLGLGAELVRTLEKLKG